MIHRVRQIGHKTLTGFMAVWLSGVVFLFCCEKINGQMKVEFCPLEKRSGHCNKSKNAASDSVEKFDSDSMDCCAFLPLLYNRSRKLERVQTFAVPPPAKLVVEPAQRRVVLAVYEPTKAYSRLESRQGTYVRNCNFRI